MIQSNIPDKKIIITDKPQGNNVKKYNRFKRLASMGKTYSGILTEISTPIDAANRFINLSLQSIDEKSQGREFLLESKKGLRKTAGLLERLSVVAKRIEKEIRKLEKDHSE